MANVSLTPVIIASECGALFGNEIQSWGEAIYEPMFAQAGARVGVCINVRKPVKFTVADIMDVSRPFVDTCEIVVIDQHKFVPMEISTQDTLLTVDQLSARVLAPACRHLASLVKSRWGLGATMLTVDMPCVNAVDACELVVNSAAGTSLRFLRLYDPARDMLLSRLDLLCGFYNQPAADAAFDVRRNALTKARAEWAARLETVRRRRAADG